MIGNREERGENMDLITILTEATCGDACWHAREEVCRCSCGGRNHGCLRTAGGEAPVRSAKIEEHPYVLAGIGPRRELYEEAERINNAAPKQIFMGVAYPWRETERGAPARLKYPSKDQIRRWPELTAWWDRDKGKPTQEFYRHGIALLWIKKEEEKDGRNIDDG